MLSHIAVRGVTDEAAGPASAPWELRLETTANGRPVDLDSTPVLIAPDIFACETIGCAYTDSCSTPCSKYTVSCTYVSCPDAC
jgi:hypothetical protein